jgi:protocatechuate 3,4-dioxygenase beta subunit
VHIRKEEMMDNQMPTRQTRRAFLRACLAMPTTFVLAACAGQAAGTPTSAPAAQAQPTSVPAAQPPTSAPSAQAQPTSAAAPAAQAPLAPTPVCGDDDDVTPAQTEGPYFKPSSPERASLLEPGMAGTRLVITGSVLTTGCQPVGRALLDFWQADDGGAYDNAGFKLRGHQYTDDQGRYTLETIVPGLYPGRTRHIHVKAQAPNQPVLTTQLYFPDEPRNSSDSIFSADLLMDVQNSGDSKAATFNFVLDVA